MVHRGERRDVPQSDSCTAANSISIRSPRRRRQGPYAGVCCGINETGSNPNIAGTHFVGSTAAVLFLEESKQTRRLGMEVLISFFALRPTFTVLGLKVVWYIYLLNTVVQTYIAVSGISRVLAQRGISMEVWLPNSIPLILGLVAQLVIVRLLIEVAAIIISNSNTSKG
ncbi:MAG TPA: hypothetical protein VIK28_11395 [Sedimentisphaerales bacterium]